MQNVISELFEYFHISNNDLVLDFGWGTGITRFFFEKQKYIGIDIQEYNFHMKKGKNVEFLVADLKGGVPLQTKSVDFVFCHGVLQYIPDGYEIVIKEIYRVLRKGKRAYIMVPSNLDRIFSQIPFLPFSKIYPFRTILIGIWFPLHWELRRRESESYILSAGVTSDGTRRSKS